MSKIIPKNTIEEIRLQNDIVDVVGSYIQLKRAGSAFKALCPFHKEKSPSFHVNPQRQSFHCFGCGQGGDVFRFVMEFESVDFTTAVRMLADRSGIQLDYEDSGEDRSERDVLYRLLQDAAQFYHRILVEMSAAEPARNYLKERDLGDDIVKDFLIGYAPERRDAMQQFAKKKGYTREQLEKAGFLAQSDGGYYERFRRRLMIPIRDPIGRVIAFTGRVLDKSQPGGKYVNSPETALFHKSKVLFAFDRARKAILENRRAIVCEGQIDAIRCHQAGILDVVASQGTALTEDHAHLVKRYADSVVLVMDPDSAGQEAAIRSAPHFLAEGLSVHVAVLPPGEDPDTMIRKNGAEPFLALIEQAPTIVEFQVDVLRRRENLENDAGLMRASQAVLATLRHAPSAILRDEFIRQASAGLGVREEALRSDLERMVRKQQAVASRRESESEENPKSRRPCPKLELALAELLLIHPETAEMIESHVPLDYISDPTCRHLVEAVLEHKDDPAWDPIAAFTGDENAECLELAARIHATDRKVSGPDITSTHAAQDLVVRLHQTHLKRRREEIRARMAQAGPEEAEALREETCQIAHDLSELRRGWNHAQHVVRM